MLHAGVSERGPDGFTGSKTVDALIGSNGCYQKQMLGSGQCDGGKIESSGIAQHQTLVPAFRPVLSWYAFSF
jgi:hypothetical protein